MADIQMAADDNFGSSGAIYTQQEGYAVDEWKKWCRLCATAEHQYINIITGLYEPISAWMAFTNCFQRRMDIQRIIEEFLGINIQEDDKLSQFICAECFQAINTMLQFRERVYKVQKMYIDLQNGDQEFTQVNRKVLYEKYNLIERDTYSPPTTNDASKLPVEEVFVPDSANENLKVKTESKIDEVPAMEVLLNALEQVAHDFGDPIGNEDKVLKSRKRRNATTPKLDVTTKTEITESCESQNSGTDDDDDYDGGLDNIDDGGDDDNEEYKDTSSKPKRKLKQTQRANKKDGTKKSKSENHQEEQPDSNESIYVCTKCKEKFQRIKLYAAHMKNEHREIICPNCPTSFRTATELRKHIKTHRSEFTCPHCERKLGSKGRLTRHINCAHGERQPFVCEFCGLTFEKKKQLTEHMVQHTDYTPFVCNVCGAGFKVKSRLKRHLQIHGEKFICPECGKQLNTRATLKDHLLVHSDKMAHKCDFCGRLFKRANTLKNHLIAHTDLRPYSCDFCDKRFSTGPSCRFHKRTMHPKELAELEASGAKAYTKNIPKLHVLKAVSKTGEHFKPLASKQAGCVKFDKGIEQMKSEVSNLEPAKCQSITE